MKQETVGFPPGLKKEATDAAKKEYISFSAFVRVAVAEKLRRQEAKNNEQST